jgi:chaperone required for assembly of F1-ATPase
MHGIVFSLVHPAPATMLSIMRELFDENGAANRRDALEAARRSMRQPLRARFFKNAEIEGREGAFSVTLDRRPIKTPARRLLEAPTHALAKHIAREWDAQLEFIDPAKMPLTRLANAIIDGVADAMPAVRAEVEKYIACDLVLYRADAPQGLVIRQAAAWDPILAWAAAALGARFRCTCAMDFRAQSEEALHAARAAIPRSTSLVDAWQLGAIHSITTLTGSALIALAVARGALSPAQAWAAAHVDEDWNIEQWGPDELALALRATRFAEMQAAALVLSHLDASS